jgi:hypothetical protein
VPRIGTLNGVTFYIYADDHNPPHVHAYYGDDAILLVIATGETLQGSLPSKQAKVARAWLADNRAMAQQKWDELNP